MADVEIEIEEQESEQLYFPEPSERQLTARAVIVGCLVGSIVSCTNIYIGLKIGWAFGASIISAVLGFSIFSLLNRKLSVLETNIAQTSGSAAGYMSSAAGLLAPIPALAMLGYEYSWYALMMWSVSVAFLGVFFAVPLRRQVIDVDKLRFPSGTATAETILAMYGDASEALAKARVLVIAGLCAGLFTLAKHFVPEIEHPPIHEWKWVPGAAFLTIAAAWGFKVYLGPSLLGAGFLIGPRVVLSLVGGVILGWGILGPFSQKMGWAPGPITAYENGPRGWLLWPGVALMVSEGLGALAFSWKTFVNAFKMPVIKSLDEEQAISGHIPNSWWIGGLIVGSILAIIITAFVFEIPWYLTLISIAISFILAIVAVRSVGETDINPIGGIGKVTQLVFGGIAPGSIETNLMSAAITAAGASQAGDMMTDLKTGKLLGAAPRKQFIAQLCGICVGILFAVPVYFVFTNAYELGSEELPAPAAMAWKAMAEVLNEGFGALPPMAEESILIAGIIGLVIAGLRQIKSIANFVPSGLAMGIAFIVPAYYSLVMFYGLVIWLIWKAIAPSAAQKYNFALASGLIAGEGLMGIVNAGLTIVGIHALGDIQLRIRELLQYLGLQ